MTYGVRPRKTLKTPSQSYFRSILFHKRRAFYEPREYTLLQFSKVGKKLANL